MNPKPRQRRASLVFLAHQVFQGPIESQEKEGRKVLGKVRNVRREVLMACEAEGEGRKSWGVFHPESSFKVGWDITLILLVVEQAISVPYIISFNVTLSDSMSRFDIASVFFFLLDIGTPHTVINFNTSYYTKGSLISERGKIAKNYLKLWFWLDGVSSFPYSWLSDGFNNSKYSESSNLANASNLLLYVRFLKFMRILRLIRLIKLKSLLVKIEDLLVSNTLAYLFMLARIGVLIFFIAHWIACGFYYVGSIESEQNPLSWTIQEGFNDNSSKSEAYVTALYYAFTTMTTVGYGDITPYSTRERMYVTSVMILSCCTFAFMIGSIGSLVEKQNAESTRHRERVLVLNQYMKTHKFPGDLQYRVRRFLEYVWENQSKDRLQEKDIQQWLSEPLNDEIYAQVNGAIIIKCKTFRDFDHNFVLQLSKLLQSESFAPGDVVFEEGQIGSKMYYVVKGGVDVHHCATASSFKILRERRFFGEIGFFASTPRCASTRCIEFTDTLTLCRDEMKTLLQKFPESQERARAIAARVNSGDLSALYIKCYVCKSIGHVATRCRLLSLDHEDVRKKWLNTRQGHTTYINPAAPPPPNHVRIDKRPIRLRYDSKNVIGMQRDAEKMFANEPLIVPAVKTYLQTSEKERNKTCSSIELSTNTLEETSVRKSKPNYLKFYKESDPSDYSDSMDIVEDVTPVSNLSFSHHTSVTTATPTTTMSLYNNPFHALAQAYYQPSPPLFGPTSPTFGVLPNIRRNEKSD